jgi:aminoglycoside phosphotransferase (APT) family kinase protein
MKTDGLQDYLSLRFPDWSRLELHNIQNITSGWETEIISFDVQYWVSEYQEVKHLIARIYPGAPWAHRAKFEFDILQSLAALGFPVPQVFAVETDSEVFEGPFLVMERILGSTMMEIMNRAQEPSFSEMIGLFGRLFVQLHSLDWKRMSVVSDPDLHANPRVVFTERLDGFREHITEHGVEFLFPIVDWLSENLQAITLLPISILHRDFHPMNILIDRNGNPYVIDWTAATLGDPRIDVAWSMLLAELHLEGGLKDMILDSYQNARGETLQDMDYFKIDACLRRLSDILISLNSGASSLGMRESTAEAMRAGINLLSHMHAIVKQITGIEIEEIERQVKRHSA